MSLTEARTELPACGRKCLDGAIAQSPCTSTDVSCICSDQRLSDAALACVMSSCTVRESLVTKNVTSHLCGLPVETDSSLIPVYSTFIGLAVVSVALRLVARVLTQAYFWWDDLANLMTFIGAATFTGLNIKAIKIGQGKDMWFVPFDDITTVVRMFFADMLLYTVSRLFFRASILLFYLRVFPPKADGKFHRLLIGSMVVNFVYNFGFIMAIIFLCRPLPYFWSQWEGLHDGHCGNYNILAWVAATTGIVFDLWMLALPLSQLMALRLPWRKKFVGSLMFFFGICVMIVSLVRLKTINEFTQTVNPTKDIVQVCLWSGIELDVGVICPCLPSFRLLLRRLLPRLMDSSPSECPSSAGYALDPALGSPSPIGDLSGRRGSAARKGSLGGGGMMAADGGTVSGGKGGGERGGGGERCCYVGALIREGKTLEEDVSNGSVSEQVEGWSPAEEHAHGFGRGQRGCWRKSSR
ncbi:hypothetical protein VTI74DRAFT_102 [Chaetomium olivicolor]